MIEDYRIKSRVGRSEGTGVYEITKRGARREKSRFVERYETPAGTFLPEEWKKRAKAAIEAGENLLSWKESKITAESTVHGCTQRAIWKSMP